MVVPCIQSVDPIDPIEPDIAKQLFSECGVADAGGTFQAANTSPDELWQIRGSDVGGISIRRTGDTEWTPMPTDGTNASRQVSGVVILDDGTAFSLVGNGDNAGKILQYNTDGTVDVLHSGLDVRANSLTVGDVGPRTRPVGWTLQYDPATDTLFAATEDGLFRCDRSTGAGSIIALAGESVRGIAHIDATTVYSPTNDQLIVATRDRGVVQVNNIYGNQAGFPNATDIGTVTRAEDVAISPNGNILVAGYEQGVFVIDPVSGLTTDATPTANTIGNNGGTVRWSSVDVHWPTGVGAATMINPTNADEWVWRTDDSIDNAGFGWESISHIPVTQQDGSVVAGQPQSRLLGYSANGGTNLTGGNHVSFVKGTADPDQIQVMHTLSTSVTTNADAIDNTQVAWVSDNACSSLLTMTSVYVAPDGTTGWSVADHDSIFANDTNASVTTEPTRVAVSGTGDGYGITNCSGVWVLLAVDDAVSTDPNHSVQYSTQAQPTSWQTNGWQSFNWATLIAAAGLPAIPAGDVPRPVSVCGYELANGSIRFNYMVDHVGFVYQDYDPVADTWTNPVIAAGSPTTNIVSVRQNTARATKCIKDGSVILHQLQADGTIWRSLDGGLSYQRIANSISASPEVRTGFMELTPDGQCAVVTNENGIYVINDVQGAATVTQLSSTETGPVAIDPLTGEVYIQLTGSGSTNMLYFEDIKTATSLADSLIVYADDHCTAKGGQINGLYATQFGSSGELEMYALYQGGGYRRLQITDYIGGNTAWAGTTNVA